MKLKQLANVLIKIVGLYVCQCAIPNLISGRLMLLRTLYAPTGISEVAMAKLSDAMFRAASWGDCRCRSSAGWRNFYI
jgi:hypothetical protein